MLHRLARENFDDKHVSTAKHEGIALDIDIEAKYVVIADLDSYLFEVNAGVDLLKNYLDSRRAVAVREHANLSPTARSDRAGAHCALAAELPVTVSDISRRRSTSRAKG